MHDADDRSCVGVRMVAHGRPHRYENTLSTLRNKHSKAEDDVVALRRVPGSGRPADQGLRAVGPIRYEIERQIRRWLADLGVSTFRARR